MKIKKLGLILGTIGIMITLSLTSCGTKVATEKTTEEVVQSEQAEEDKEKVEDKQSEDDKTVDKTTDKDTSTNSNNSASNTDAKPNKQESNKQESNTNTNTNANTNNSGNTSSSTENTNGLTNLTYTSKDLGITFNVPESWKGKYNVIEESGKISVYMKHKDNNAGTGLLFVIKKQDVDGAEVLNSIDGVDSVDINGQTLIVGGPTGYCMEDGDSLIPTYNQMVGECIYPVNSIKAI